MLKTQLTIDMTSNLPVQNIKNKIYEIRGVQVMLDSDLAKLYEVKSIRLREQVKRNIKRFPGDFMFRLTDDEVELMVSQNAIPSIKILGGHNPFVFTEQGVAMLSGILRSSKAVEVNIKIMRAFVEMRYFLVRNADVFQKFQKIDQKMLEYDDNFRELFKALEQKQLAPKQGIFFNGQVFDAHIFVSDLIKKANKNIVLIDNYVDEKTLTLLSKKKPEVKANIYTKNINTKLLQDVEKFNEQYKNLILNKFKESHDWFLIIDQEIYHIGASLKDLGKKWFAFSKLHLQLEVILSRLK